MTTALFSLLHRYAVDGIFKHSSKQPISFAKISHHLYHYFFQMSKLWSQQVKIKFCQKKYLTLLIQDNQAERIDGCELYCSFLLLSKGSYETYLKSIIDIFGFENPGRITKNQFFFFLDSFYRMLPKILIPKGFQKPSPQNNLRLQYTDINKFIDLLFQGNKNQIQRNQIYQYLMKVPQLNEFLKYLQKKCTAAAQNSRLQALNKMKFQAQIRNCLSDMVLKVHLQLEKKSKQ